MIHCFDISHLSVGSHLHILSGKEYLVNEIHTVYVVQKMETEELRAEMESMIKGTFLVIPYRMEVSEIMKIIKEKWQGKVAGVAVVWESQKYEEENLASSDFEFPVFLLEDYQYFNQLVFELFRMVDSGIKRDIIENEILNSIMYDNEEDIDYLLARAKFYGYDILCPHFSFALRFYIHDIEQKKMMPEIIAASCQMFKRYFGDVLSAKFNNGCIVLLKEGVDREKIQFVVNKIKKTYPQVIYYGGIGNLYTKPKDFKRSIDESRKIVNILSELNYGKNTIKDFHYMFIYFIIFQYKDTEMMRTFYERTLLKIIQYDAAHDADLKHTLRVYLEENQNNTIAAEKLGIHRNTLKLRIEKIEELTKKSIYDLEDRFDLCLSLYIDDIISNERIE